MVYANVPLVTFLGLMHRRIALAAFVLGGVRCIDSGGIHNAAFTQCQAVFLQVLVHLFEQYPVKIGTLEEMLELENGGFVRQLIQLWKRLTDP